MSLDPNPIGLLVPWLLGSALLLSSTAAFAAPFERTLSLHSVGFTVTANDEGLLQTFTVKARRGATAFPTIQESVDGQVVGAEVEDLNSVGLPDLFVYERTAGSSSRCVPPS
ncbi:MAG: hypothetical protein VKJ66_01170 [Synechococcus sp.]|nr:hypothetical protein [Synechococcus sp.]